MANHVTHKINRYIVTKKARTKKATTSVKKPVYSYSVVDRTYVTVTREGDPLNKWDGDDTLTEHNVSGIKQDTRGEIASALKLEVGDSAYLVWVIYSSGSSFHRAEGEYLHGIAVFDNFEKAMRCAAAIEEHNRHADDIKDTLSKSYNRWRVNYVDNEGQPDYTHAHWIGYFDSLDCCEVKKVVVLSEAEARRRS